MSVTVADFRDQGVGQDACQQQRRDRLGYGYLRVAVHRRDDRARRPDDAVDEGDGLAGAERAEPVVVYHLDDAVILGAIDCLRQLVVVDEDQADVGLAYQVALVEKADDTAVFVDHRHRTAGALGYCLACPPEGLVPADGADRFVAHGLHRRRVDDQEAGARRYRTARRAPRRRWPRRGL
ncbi:MAG: hypothetical protein MZV63_46725 [Marinilabiliales bacterium]|nr:hypothetical protein [Marinilabiliales bacterium]